ncbi:HlyD family type I secretion periplasmic adaptor subunit [Ensifer sp. ENS04]|uniref:HlyD family type I secretion periplasmic adaptor subunit n=1 Tax=Ensifer sp. ENS04 TaxID=2769281 RepID=UPI001782F9E4|nr:HlyD family type I secretion periplasmic adaptor subunit [Ensifer sp. ENS04]MBD9538962.1 HlyD family type I secretion periplasmic adaptor subunit [Ensifer sp. ENS04]
MPPAPQQLKNYFRTTFAFLVAMLAACFLWAHYAKVAGAVVGHGAVVVDGHPKTVQHLTGGIIADIRAREGLVVRQGDLLLRLDDTLTRANLAVINNEIDQYLARRVRLSAEREQRPKIQLPNELKGRLAEAKFAANIQSETALFEARRTTMAGQVSQLEQRIAQISRETEGLHARRVAKKDEQALIEEEIGGVSSLHQQGLATFSRVAQLRRIKSQLAGEHGQISAEIARAETRAVETRLQILQINKELQTEVMADMQEVDAKLADLEEKKNAAVEELRRINITAPQTGIVHELQVNTVGGVVPPGQSLMSIVPNTGRLIVEAKVQLTDIDQIAAGQGVRLRFPAFNQRTTPEKVGQVLTIGADATTDTRTSQAWYSVRVKLDEEGSAGQGIGLALHPGMPTEVFFRTRERSVLSYLMKPIMDQLERSFRDD